MLVYLSILWVVFEQTVHHCDIIVKATDLPLAGFYRNKQIKQGRELDMRTYLVVIDETEEAGLALRFASRRAMKTNGALHILALVEKEDFVAWGGVQATLEEEAKNRAEALVSSAAGSLFDETGIRPSITVKSSRGPNTVRKVLSEVEGVGALVLGAAATGAPGPLVTHFAAEAGTLPCPVMVVPGSLSKEDIDRLS